ncbi:MAG: hypothetical protein ACJ75J_13285 [Cytophagaceae bacterium]
MKRTFIYSMLWFLIGGSCFSIQTGCSSKPKSATEKRMKKQEKHRKKHPCPQIDC